MSLPDSKADADKPTLSTIYRAMRLFGYPDSFVTSALILGREYDGILELMYLWHDALLKREDVDPYRADIQELMNDYLVSHLKDGQG